MTTPAEVIIARARQGRTLPASESWREGFELFLSDVAKSETLLPSARENIEAHAADTLAARFAAENWLADHPAAAAAPVSKPLFILGMPRAGTTLLLNLLRFDPQRRVYWHWEGNREIPPVEASRLGDDPRIALRSQEVNQMLDSGALPRNHHVEMGDEPTECNWIMAQDFKAYFLLVHTIVPNFFEWLMHDADMLSAYQYHSRMLRVLQSSAPGSWTLKYPAHALATEEILKVYPDARIVMTHRDPIKPVASSCSLCDQILSLQNHTIDRKALGYQTLTLNLLSAQRMSAARDAHPEVPFLDIHYRDFTRDPLATVRALYAFEEMELTPRVAARMQAALDLQQSERQVAGAHRYRLEDYGLTLDGLNRVFGDYIDRYQIELERN